MKLRELLEIESQTPEMIVFYGKKAMQSDPATLQSLLPGEVQENTVIKLEVKGDKQKVVVKVD